MKLVAAIIVFDVWLLLFDASVIAWPKISKVPKHVVPKARSHREASAVRSLKVLAPCHVRILTWIEDEDEIDPVDGDVIHFAATAYNEMNVTYSVLRLKRDWAVEPNTTKPQGSDLLNINAKDGDVEFSKFIRRYNYIANTGKKPIDKTSRCSAVLCVSEASSSLRAKKLDFIEAAEMLWGVEGPSTAVMFLDSPRDGRLPEQMTTPKRYWFKNMRAWRWKYMCSLQAWTQLVCLLGSNVDASKGEIRIRREDWTQAPRGDFEGGVVTWAQYFKNKRWSDDVLLEVALPRTCEALNATFRSLVNQSMSYISRILDGNIEEFVSEITTHLAGLGRVADKMPAHLMSDKRPLRFSETYPKVSFLFVSDPLSRKLSALVDPMDTGTWIWTLISVAAVSILTAFVVQSIGFVESAVAIALTLLGQGDVPATEKGHVRTVLALWLLATIVIVGGYTGLLFSMLTDPVAPWYPQTFQELNEIYEGDIISTAVLYTQEASISEQQLGNDSDSDRVRSGKGVPKFQFWYKYELSFNETATRKLAFKHGLGRFFQKLKTVGTGEGVVDVVEDELFRKYLKQLDVPLGSTNFNESAESTFTDSVYRLPETYVHINTEIELLLHQLLVETMGLQKILRRSSEPIPLLSRVDRWIAPRSSATDEIERKLQQFTEGGFMSWWKQTLTRWDAVQELIDFQKSVRTKLEDDEEKEAPKQDSKKLRLTPMLANFISKRNVMVHLFNDFSSSANVYLQTVDWSVRRLGIKVLMYVFELWAALLLAATAAFLIELAIAYKTKKRVVKPKNQPPAQQVKKEASLTVVITLAKFKNDAVPMAAFDTFEMELQSRILQEEDLNVLIISSTYRKGQIRVECADKATFKWVMKETKTVTWHHPKKGLQKFRAYPKNKAPLCKPQEMFHYRVEFQTPTELTGDDFEGWLTVLRKKNPGLDTQTWRFKGTCFKPGQRQCRGTQVFNISVDKESECFIERAGYKMYYSTNRVHFIERVSGWN